MNLRDDINSQLHWLRICSCADWTDPESIEEAEAIVEAAHGCIAGFISDEDELHLAKPTKEWLRLHGPYEGLDA